ncbi:MAG: hypothetical protein ACTS6A_02230 [Candidatus Hodgkinia cicadicola]
MLEEKRLDVKLDNLASLVKTDSKLRRIGELNELCRTNVKTWRTERRVERRLEHERRLITFNI